MTAAAAAPEKTLVLPDALSSRAEAFTRALAVAMPWGWDEDGPSHVEAEQPAAIAKALIPSVHLHLLNRRIGYLFRQSIKDHGKTTLVKASKVSGKLQHFARLDFLVEVNWDAYRYLGKAQKIAALDHALSYFEVDDDKLLLKTCDVEEFTTIVRRWGQWNLSLRLFTAAAQEAPQFDLFSSLENVVRESVEKAAPNGKRSKSRKPTRVGDVQVQGVGVALT